MSVVPYLNFPGNCREAVEYYARVFRTEPPHFMTFGDMPEDPSFKMPDETKNFIMHTRLLISGSWVMFSDVVPGMEFVPGNNVSLNVWTADRDEIASAFNALKEGGRVSMDLQDTGWSKLYGALTDKYGIEWQFDLDSGETYP